MPKYQRSKGIIIRTIDFDRGRDDDRKRREATARGDVYVPDYPDEQPASASGKESEDGRDFACSAARSGRPEARTCKLQFLPALNKDGICREICAAWIYR